jgi:hypothetical protein
VGELTDTGEGGYRKRENRGELVGGGCRRTTKSPTLRLAAVEVAELALVLRVQGWGGHR